MKTKLTIIPIVSMLLLFLVPINSKAQSTYPKEYQTQIMDAVNEKREEAGLKKLEIDPQLCELSEVVALDSELAYPKQIDSSWKVSPKYKQYLVNYDKYQVNTGSMLDLLVDRVKKTNGVAAFSQEEITRKYTDFEPSGGIENVAADPDITDACVGMSDGTKGYKAFDYFIGGIKNQNAPTPTAEEPKGNWFTRFWDNLMSIF